MQPPSPPLPATVLRGPWGVNMSTFESLASPGATPWDIFWPIESCWKTNWSLWGRQKHTQQKNVKTPTIWVYARWWKHVFIYFYMLDMLGDSPSLRLLSIIKKKTGILCIIIYIYTRIVSNKPTYSKNIIYMLTSLQAFVFRIYCIHTQYTYNPTWSYMYIYIQNHTFYVYTHSSVNSDRNGLVSKLGIQNPCVYQQFPKRQFQGIPHL